MVDILEASAHDEQVALAEELMDKEDWRGAAHEAKKVLDDLEPSMATIAQAALTRGRALMTQTLTNMSEKGELPPMEVFDEIWKTYELSKKINPDCDATKDEMLKVSHLLREIPRGKPPKEVRGADFDVVVVGAGAAGIGTALMLTKTFGVNSNRVVIMERGDNVGETFRRWPEEMRFISPSFNQQGWTASFDLNSIASGTSPAYSLHSEHPSGKEYAEYLSAIAKLHKLNVRCRTEVVSVTDVAVKKDNPLFDVEVRSVKTGDSETIKARYIVWAAGEFQYPKENSATAEEGEEKKSDESDTGNDVLPGSNLCLHNSQVRSWAKLPGDDFIIIGGYESGCDAAFNLSKAGKQCQVLASTSCWNTQTTDPSAELAPYTAARIREVLAKDFSPSPKLYAPLRVVRIEKETNGGFNVVAEWKKEEASVKKGKLRGLVMEDPSEPRGTEGSTLVLHTPNPPILCTGFDGSVAAAAGHLFEFANKKDNKQHRGCLDGAPLLTQNDESTIVPGVFLVGPTVSHGSLSFCFVYKFRQRFGIVANAICDGLGIDTRAAVEECRKANMYLDNFSCCGDSCGDVC
eukprot:CAMPEP_0197176748 /NCGR_PEP_ID=MMETSP1423-20130617/2562_1 /TAXON_ID=476441 /ORGANISM="Pseudo-nitzschia heimii, Strain UNC1101" /LENGTH=575 /DNA_ID=CAMNT_0042626159 /DNA_START=255 /DNA_END=1982 /DNA_ORIENTATION=+